MDELDELVSIAQLEENFTYETILDEFYVDIKIEASETESAHSQNIYWIYQKWCIENNKPIISRRKFFREFNKKFVKYKDTYKIVEEPFKLTKEEWFLMRADYRGELFADLTKLRKSKKRGNKKKQDQTSES